MPPNLPQQHLPTLTDALIPLPGQVSPEASLKDVLMVMSQLQHSSCQLLDANYQSQFNYLPPRKSSCVVVVENQRLVGMLTEQDIVHLTALGQGFSQILVKEIMGEPTVTITLNDSQEEDVSLALVMMRQHSIRHLPVVDREGKLQGLVTSESISRLLQPANLFKLRRVEEVMITEVIHAPPTSSVLQLSELMSQHQVNCLVIVESTREEKANLIPLGIVTASDIVQFHSLELNLATTQAQQVMSTPLVCPSPYDSLWKAHQQMQQLGVRRLVVADDCGHLQGIITQTDMLGVLDTTQAYEALQLLQHTVEEKTVQLKQLNQDLQHQIEEKKQLEAKLFTSEMKMRAVLEAMSELVIVHRVEENDIEVMPTSWDASYSQATVIINKTLQQILHSYQSEVGTNPVRKVLDTRQPCSFEYNLTVEETQLWFLARISNLSDNAVLWVVRDITQRKHLEQALFQEKELAQVTLQSIGDAVITTDAGGKVLEINPVAEQLTGWKAPEAKGLPLLDIFKIVSEETRQPAENPVQKALEEGCIVGLANHTILIARDGTEYYIADSAAPICDRAGQQMGAVMVFHDVTESRQLALQLSWQATHDGLTKLYNRREFERKIVEAIHNSTQKNSQYVLCYLDLDQFKIVNDSCGHVAGDELLRQVADNLQRQVRSTDAIGRLGGDEFGILLSRCSLEQAEKLAEKLRKSIHEIRFFWQRKTFTIGVSIGLVALNAETQDLNDILTAADAACFAAKHRGRNCVHIYRADDQELARQQGEVQWLSRLTQALAENRFRLYSQKIIPLAKGAQTEHHEVLLRLVDEQGQIIPPMAFIPAAERYNLMPKIDRWVIETFISRYQHHCQIGDNQRPAICDQWYSLNLSGASLNNEQFVSFLQEQLAQCTLPEKICFEITETTAISNLTKAVKFMHKLLELGCSFALDDFGSGMSSLIYLKNLPVNYLKIDGGFVKNMVNDPIDGGMVESCNRMAHLMGIQTIAEFVENEATLEQLRSLGVDYAQGHAIAKPCPLIFN